MDFIIRLSILTNWKRESYNLILVIVKWLIKIVYYKPVKVTFDALRLVKVIFQIIVWQYNLFNSIVSNKRLPFTLKF